MDAKAISYNDLPDVLQDGGGEDCLIISEGMQVLDIIRNVNLEQAAQLVNWAYRLGRDGRSLKEPSTSELALLAHRLSEHYRQKLDKQNARIYDEVSYRFVTGLQIAEIFNEDGIVIAWKVPGKTMIYNVDRSYECSCASPKHCWHREAIKIYTGLKESNGSNTATTNSTGT